MIKICPICQKEFHTKRKNAIFCTLKCRYEFQKTENNPSRKRKKIICLNCGKEKTVMNYTTTKFCCLSCYWNFLRNHPDIKFQQVTDSKIKKECLSCKKEFKVHLYRKNVKFCSRSCHDNYRRDFLTCPTCGKDIKTPKYEKRKYCSEECAFKGVDKRKSSFSKSIQLFLDNFDVKYNIEHRINLENEKYYYVDFLLDKNVFIECYGDYWHCNPRKYDENYFHKKIFKSAKEIWYNDNIRLLKLNQHGYKEIIIWEFDWNKNSNFFEDLKNKLIELEIISPLSN